MSDDTDYLLGNPFLEIFNDISGIFRSYHKDRRITRGDSYQALESILPIIGLWRNIIRTAGAVISIALALPLLGIAAGVVGALGWLALIVFPMKTDSPILFTMGVLAKIGLAITLPLALTLPFIGLAAGATLAVVSITITLAIEIPAAAIRIIATPISLITRPTITIAYGLINGCKMLSRWFKNRKPQRRDADVVAANDNDAPEAPLVRREADNRQQEDLGQNPAAGLEENNAPKKTQWGSMFKDAVKEKPQQAPNDAPAPVVGEGGEGKALAAITPEVSQLLSNMSLLVKMR